MDDKSADEIIYVFLTIAIPLSIRYGMDAYSKRKKPKAPMIELPPYPASKWDLISKIFLVACAVWYVNRFITTPYNFLKELGVEVNSPSFEVRNHFKDYMTERFPGWTLRPLSESPSANLFDKDIYAEKIRPLEELYDKLRAGKWRRWYGRFGHHAIVNCNWCLDENDFSIFGASQTAIDYVIFLFLFGLGTMTPRKNKWRNWTFGVLCIPFLLDCFSYAASPLELTAALSKDTQRRLFFTLHVVRHGVFAIALFIVAIWDKKRLYNDADAIQEVCRQSSSNFGRLISLGLTRATISNDPSLRDEFFNFYQKNSSLKMSDDDVQKLMQEIPEPLQNRMKSESEFFSKDAIANAARMKVLNFSN